MSRQAVSTVYFQFPLYYFMKISQHRELLEYISHMKMADESEGASTGNSENKSSRHESSMIEETTFYIDGDEFKVINTVKIENKTNDYYESNCNLSAIGENSELQAKENDSVGSDAKVSKQNPDLPDGILGDRKNLVPRKQVRYTLNEPHERISAENAHDKDRRKSIECQETAVNVVINGNMSVDTVDSETGENEDTVDNAMNYKKEAMRDEAFSATETKLVEAISSNKVRMSFGS